jgi:hypothetical protein
MRPPGRDDVAGAIRPTKAGYARRPDAARPSPNPSHEHPLLNELWQISHFGWIPEAAIRRSLIISGAHEIPAALAERLRQLLERGWAEQRQSDGTGEHEWRLTDSGRNAR